MDYDPKAVVMTFCGVPVTGYAKGSFIKVEPAEDSFKKYVGADGETSRTRVADETVNVTLNLSQTSPSNAVLSAQHKLDRKSGTGKGPLMIKDLKGTTLVYAKNAWIRKMATADFGDEINAKEWAFDTGKAEYVNGGNEVV
ncbi:MAG: DUF3277 family protein [Spirochaetales bacterium]|nr:DUF3277 family protein [Spirochaetales bacterium]